ncbi:collagen-like domain-containing protein [Granulicella mallensis]|uniref:Collagen triple helix repeat-containing protein n=1 Tax=Granulicella mallensis (strain ATCC BAA-1857 / DSM 23137 / MP5ACTX8) TaxID=682795 RepID=G8NQP3_GRAMM|nr:collagen-like protein [Granulicella mallensis]AEU37269.1 Collagen triple helix repeat-containing protein [Granulicella mallensis MP5ACTX8]
MAGIRYDSNVVTSAKNVPIGADAPVYTVPYGSVAVYIYGAPPETLASLFADQNLTQPIANPLQADSEGRFGFWISAGVYTYTVTSAAGVELGSYAVTLTSPVGPAGTIQVGEVTGGPSAVVANVGTGTAAILNFTLPQGPQGNIGPVGPQGEVGPLGPVGPIGPQGIQGEIGPQGNPGASGISLPIYATTAAGVAPGTGVAVNGYFLIPSANVDGLYDSYQNVAGTSVFSETIPAQNVVSRADGLYLRDGQGFLVKLFDTATGAMTVVEPRLEELEAGIFKSQVGLMSAGTGLTTQPNVVLTDGQGFSAVLLNPTTGDSPVFDLTYGLQNAINSLNNACLAFSTSVRSRYNPTMETFRFGLNYVPAYGQSLMAGYQCQGVYDTTQSLGNLCIGNQVRFATSSGASLPNGDTLNHPCVEAFNSAGPAGDTGLTCFANYAKQLINIHERVANDTRVFLATNVSCPGQPISVLIPGAPPDSSGQNLWSRMVRAAGYAATNASNASLSIGAVGFIYDQGEQDYGQANPATDWMSDMLTMRAANDALNVASFGQVNQAGIYTYQTGGSFENNAFDDISIGMAQWNLAKTQPNWFMFGPHYAYPDFGGHKTGNSYRWMMAMCAKVWFRTAVLRQGWLPLGPHKTVIYGNTLLIGFHVPAPPLTVQTAYDIATPVNFPDLGFNLFDAKGFIAATYSIVADTVVQCIPSRTVDWTTAQLKYADIGNGSQNATTMKGTQHAGRGNITDSDTAVSQAIYVSPDQDDSLLPVTTPPQPTAAYDVVGLSGLPYELNNWCVAFNIKPLTFEG